jgi:hypothetical protein
MNDVRANQVKYAICQAQLASDRDTEANGGVVLNNHRETIQTG